jgi:hypothetical protein
MRSRSGLGRDTRGGRPSLNQVLTGPVRDGLIRISYAAIGLSTAPGSPATPDHRPEP